MSVGLASVLIALCLLGEGFFSGSETAITSADRLRLRAEADKGSSGAALALSMLEQRTDLLGTCLIGTNLSVVGASTVAAAALVSVGGEWVEALTVAALYPFILIFGELVPKSLFRHYADSLAPTVVYPIRLFSLVFWPLLRMLGFLSNALARLFGASENAHNPTREDIQRLLDSPEQVALGQSDRELIQRVFSFTEATVEDVMKPLIEVVSVSETATAAQAIRLMSEHGYSRLPTYADRVDQVTGIITHNDLLFLEDLSTPLTEVKRTVVFVPETKRVEELFHELRKNRQRIAIPVDEYGGAVGLLTMEDILEEIVGEIDDEHDDAAGQVRRTADDVWLVSARIESETLHSAIGFDLPEGDWETLAGFLLSELGHVPDVGEKLTHAGWTLEVTKASDRAIVEVRLRRPPTAG